MTASLSPFPSQQLYSVQGAVQALLPDLHDDLGAGKGYSHYKHVTMRK